MAPGLFTELFFLDEATALAAGHRPCAECRRADYNGFVEIFSEASPSVRGADAIDEQLHAERLVGRRRERRFFNDVRYDELPDGTYVLYDGKPCLVLGPRLLPWSPGGYLTQLPRPGERTGDSDHSALAGGGSRSRLVSARPTPSPQRDDLGLTPVTARFGLLLAVAEVHRGDRDVRPEHLVEDEDDGLRVLQLQICRFPEPRVKPMQRPMVALEVEPMRSSPTRGILTRGAARRRA